MLLGRLNLHSQDYNIGDATITEEDIIKLFATFEEIENAIGNPELIYSPDYPGLAMLRQVYFNRLTDKMDLKGFFEFFKWFPSSREDQNVRTIYTFQRRSVVMPMMEVFDVANMSESCARRNVTVVAPQAFSLLNSPFTHVSAAKLAERVRQLAGPDKDRQIERAFQLALSRSPTPLELEKARGVELERLALVLFNLNEFVYLD